MGLQWEVFGARWYLIADSPTLNGRASKQPLYATSPIGLSVITETRLHVRATRKPGVKQQSVVAQWPINLRFPPQSGDALSLLQQPQLHALSSHFTKSQYPFPPSETVNMRYVYFGR